MNGVKDRKENAKHYNVSQHGSGRWVGMNGLGARREWCFSFSFLSPTPLSPRSPSIHTQFLSLFTHTGTGLETFPRVLVHLLRDLQTILKAATRTGEWQPEDADEMGAVEVSDGQGGQNGVSDRKEKAKHYNVSQQDSEGREGGGEWVNKGVGG
jgi:hypothetical protein